ncbi:YopX family protein [Agarilytica rhodophyticola]|uniref:YopX family protein n=1 Tax=Agarilytica rhodophyticola TaxID=1737490 RepID=UPI000B342C6F|nr:YopX family protein [Agarilytica rhodophyticola]
MNKKFRAWDIKDKIMRYSVGIDFDGYAFIEGPCTAVSTDEVIDGSIMQFTGVKDKDGKEIYEGDIVEHVRYFDGTCDHYGDTVVEPRTYKRVGHITITPSSGVTLNGYIESRTEDIELVEIKKYNSNPGVWDKCCRVLGNIYESPELKKLYQKAIPGLVFINKGHDYGEHEYS